MQEIRRLWCAITLPQQRRQNRTLAQRTKAPSFGFEQNPLIEINKDVELQIQTVNIIKKCSDFLPFISSLKFFFPESVLENTRYRRVCFLLFC